MDQFSHLYMTTGKAKALTRHVFVSKVMSLIFNMLPRFVLIFFFKEYMSFNFMAAVTISSNFGTQENKICHCFHWIKPGSPALLADNLPSEPPGKPPKL